MEKFTNTDVPIINNDPDSKVIGTTSWKGYEYSLFFYGLIRGLRPKIAVELGVYEGYASYWIAAGLLCNQDGARLDSYDLWEDYPYNHCKMEIAEKNLENLPVNLIKRDAKDVHTLYKDKSVDFLMVDLSNDGDTYITYLYNWFPKLSNKAIVLMEGGHPARDYVPWMVDYKKKPILEALKTNEFILSHYNIAITESFPACSIFTVKK